MTPQIFYHIGCLNLWKDVVRQQLEELKRAGLKDSPLWFGMAGATSSEVSWAMLCAEQAGLHVVEVAAARHLDAFERPTMRMLERRVREVVADTAVLYFHTKGVSASGDRHKDRWRELMMEEVVVGWERCIALLRGGCDAVGVNWRDMPPISHFCGNFWWARAGYLVGLEPFDAYYANPRYPADWGEPMRLGCEFWISSAKVPPRIHSLVCRNVDFVQASELDRISRQRA